MKCKESLPKLRQQVIALLGSRGLPPRTWSQVVLNSPDELHEFIGQTIEKLRKSQLDARPLEGVLTTPYTTSSEWLGDLGIALRKTMAQPIPDTDLRADLNRLMAVVHSAWPDL